MYFLLETKTDIFESETKTDVCLLETKTDIFESETKTDVFLLETKTYVHLCIGNQT